MHGRLYSEKFLMMDRKKCPKHVKFYSKNKFEKFVHLVGFIIRIYHDVKSAECQKRYYIHCFPCPFWERKAPLTDYVLGYNLLPLKLMLTFSHSLVSLCGIEGFAEFLNPLYVDWVLSLQAPTGCFAEVANEG